MNESRSITFVVFADLAFFLFSVLVMGYQYVQIVEADEVPAAFEVHLPQLNHELAPHKMAAPDDPRAETVLIINETGDVLLNGTPSTLVDVTEYLAAHRERPCTLLIDRRAASEHLVELLGVLNRHPPTMVRMEYLLKETT